MKEIDNYTYYSAKEIPSKIPAGDYLIISYTDDSFTLRPSPLTRAKTWAKRVLRDLEGDFEFTFPGDFTVARRISDGTIGVTRCGPDDDYSVLIGKAVAVAKAANLYIPDYI